MEKNPPKTPQERNIERADAAASKVWDRYLYDGHMDTVSLNKVFAPELVRVGAKKHKSFWILSGDSVCSGVWLQRSQWSNQYYINIGACPPDAVPDKHYEFPIHDRLDDVLIESPYRPRGWALDFGNDGPRRTDRIEMVREIAKSVAQELVAWLSPFKLRSFLQESGHRVTGAGIEWLSSMETNRKEGN